ncbi:type II toxin-antitoxin system HicB family antitoxin [Anaerosalibacter massiliensis]|uniref:Type II toxin-antitoxin system HicB family antitoxin n=1 Tax=Anaerosalibacter massiliensis TaxID=1347392 RepID=A0A9X2S3R0_9FIRM|nr:type II toxin-antitoxin system HicB family antitoxin [Anaerosalibacter massiliensis]MCR2042688.1 type II toxin-antitoxin system HicB family antitoxin [Anaerosalibacter massiliensis]
MKIGYYAIFNYDEYDEYGISISFPDLPECISCAKTYDEGILMATEALELATFEKKVHEMPKVTPLEDINLSDKEKAVFISYNTEDLDLSTFIFYDE